MTRTCVFCGSTPLTREHAYPDWIAALFTSEQVTYERTIQDRRDEHAMRSSWQQRPFEVKVRAVCEDCNSGWMSDLEQEAAPLLTPMIRGQDGELDSLAATVVATWAAKTMLILRLLASRPQELDVAADAYPWVFEQRMPPPQERIWIGYYDGSGQWPTTFNYYGMFVAAPGADEEGGSNAHGCSFSVGHLVFGLFGHSLAAQTETRPRVAGSKLRLLWPNYGDSVPFPPPESLVGDEELHELSLPPDWRPA